MKSLLDVWAKTNPDSMFEFFSEAELESLSPTLAEPVFKHLGSLGKVLEFLDVLGGLDPDARGRAIGQMFEGWADKDPEAAMEMALNTGSEDLQLRALQGAISASIQNDAVGFFDWMEALPPDESKDQVIQALVEGSLSASGAEGLLQFVAQVTDENIRQTLLHKTIDSAFKTKPENAAGALEKIDLTVPERSRVQSILNALSQIRSAVDLQE